MNPWPFVVTAYLEKAGYGSQAAAPVVKCTFMALSDLVPVEPVQLSEPLDLNDTVSAPSLELDLATREYCYRSRFGDGVQTQVRETE